MSADLSDSTNISGFAKGYDVLVEKGFMIKLVIKKALFSLRESLSLLIRG